jgi:DNA-binding transcriptional MocR family regulator
MPSPLRSRSASPKHLRVADLLERDIRQLAPGTPIMPVTALMERFQVSQGTVVHALRTLRMRGLITRPAGKKRLVTSGRGRHRDAVLNVLVLCPNWSSPDYNTTNQALLDEARRQRCALESVHYGAEWGGPIRREVAGDRLSSRSLLSHGSRGCPRPRESAGWIDL